MPILLDTNILVRLSNAVDTQYATADRAVRDLHRCGEELLIVPQNLIEFRNVATRPIKVNGLGLSAAEAELSAARFEAQFPLLPETPDFFPAWKAIVQSLGIIGKQVHDARLVAACHVHAVTHLLTFNTPHFARMAGFGPGLIVIHPSNV